MAKQHKVYRFRIAEKIEVQEHSEPSEISEQPAITENSEQLEWEQSESEQLEPEQLEELEQLKLEQLEPERTESEQLEPKQLEQPKQLENQRIDKVLSALFPASLSRSYVQKLLKEGSVLVNGAAVKSNYRVKYGDEICLELPSPEEPDILPEEIPLDILYEDEDILVVNKPKGMVVHPAAGHSTGTLVNAVLAHCRGNLSGINGVTRPGIVHRIDKDTTGSVIICKNDTAHNHIAAQLKEHSLVRRYHAICYGVLKEDTKTICAPIGRHPTDRKKMAVNEKNGKTAVTHIRVLQRYHDYTYIECRLETGRTHQIRVHMASIGHPLLGDEIYAPGRTSPYRLEGQCLHAKILGFRHPRTGQYIETDAPLPAYFQHLLNVFR